MHKTQKKQMISWNDIKNYGVDVAKHYGLDQRETERQLRTHLDGASEKERREIYETFYGNKK